MAPLRLVSTGLCSLWFATRCTPDFCLAANTRVQTGTGEINPRRLAGEPAGSHFSDQHENSSDGGVAADRDGQVEGDMTGMEGDPRVGGAETGLDAGSIGVEDAKQASRHRQSIRRSSTNLPSPWKPGLGAVASYGLAALVAPELTDRYDWGLDDLSAMERARAVIGLGALFTSAVLLVQAIYRAHSRFVQRRRSKKAEQQEVASGDVLTHDETNKQRERASTQGGEGLQG